MNGTADAWRISAEERSRHDAQFAQLAPMNGFVTGDKAKAFFMKSGLPLAVLGQIWNLADYNSDGKLSAHEFSVAMHLVKCKLESKELPSTLPLSLRIDTTLASSTSTSGTSSMNSGGSLNHFTFPGRQGSLMGSMAPMALGGPTTTSTFAMAPSGLTATSATLGSLGFGGPLPTGPPFGSPPIQQADTWAVPPTSRQKYTLQFNELDKQKRGWLGGQEARGVLMQSGLPTHQLASVWTLADVDSNGRLGSDEFVLAMHLIDLAKAGQLLPGRLPPELIPPAFRQTSATPSTLPSLGLMMQPLALATPAKAQNGNTDYSFVAALDLESKRRENFLKGQEELARRQEALKEQLRREEEARREKQREEQERLQREREERERARLAELERQRERVRQLEFERVEALRREQETREQARRELEVRRLVEQLNMERARELQAIEQLKMLVANMHSESDNIATKKKETAAKIDQARTSVTDHTNAIELMRRSRDTLASELNDAEAESSRLSAEYERLRRTRTDLKSQTQQLVAPALVDEHQRLLSTHGNKQLSVQRLKMQVEQLESDALRQRSELDKQNTTNGDARTSLTSLKMQNTTLKNELRSLVSQSRQSGAADPPTSRRVPDVTSPSRELVSPPRAYGPPRGGPPRETRSTSSVATVASPHAETSDDVTYYRAVYDFDSRNQDELCLAAGDLLRVHSDAQTLADVEPDWLKGEKVATGQVGLFPKNYVEATVAPSDSSAFHRVQLLQVVAQQPYDSEDVSQLSFTAGARISVMQQAGEWWYGETGGRAGWFPKAYVRTQDASTTDAVATGTNTNTSASTNSTTNPANSGNSTEYCVALFVYTGDPGDLQLAEGDLIEVSERNATGWWVGSVCGRPEKGQFPENYVRSVTVSEAREIASQKGVSLDSAAPTVSNSASAKPQSQEMANATKAASSIKKPEICSVIADYNAQADNQLTIKKGQMIMLKRRDDPNWWEGELQARGQKKQTGLFPASYVKLMGVSDRVDKLARPNTPEVTTAGTDSTSRYSNTTPTLTVNHQRTSTPSRSSTSTPTPTSAPVPTLLVTNNNGTLKSRVQLRTLYSYIAANSDELSFAKDEVLYLIEKESDPDWWFCESSAAKQGFVPHNYVKLLEPTSNNNKNNSSSDINSIGSNTNTSTNTNTNTNGNTMVSISSVTSGVTSVLSDREKKRQLAIQELIDTEDAYIVALNVVRELFLEPVRRANVLSNDELTLLTGSWSQLLEAGNVQLLAALRERRETKSDVSDNVGDILVSKLPQVAAYKRYCSEQGRVKNLVEAKSEPGSRIGQIHDEFLRSSRTGLLSVSSFLLRPMQRITKYPLLIQKIIEYTPANHPDSASLNEALSKANQLCSEVNEDVRLRENAERLEWLQTRVHNDQNSSSSAHGLLPARFLSPTNCVGMRQLLHFGVLIKVKSGKELIAFLFNDFLLFTTPTYAKLPSSTSASNLSAAVFSNNTESVSACLPKLFTNDPKMALRIYREPLFLHEIVVTEGCESTSTAMQEQCLTLGMTSQSSSSSSASALQLRATSTVERDSWKKQIVAAAQRCVETERSRCEALNSNMRMGSGIGRLILIVQEAGELTPGSRGEARTNPFCEATMNGAYIITPVLKSTLAPKWNKSMQFLIFDLDADRLTLTIYHRDLFSPNDFLGTADIPVSSVWKETGARERHTPVERRVPLAHVNRGYVAVRLDIQLFAVSADD